MNLGNAYLLTGDEKANDYYKKSLEISTATGALSEIADSNANLGIAHHFLA